MYKIITGDTPQMLADRVNKFLEDVGIPEDVAYLGPPQVLGHDCYAQALLFDDFEENEDDTYIVEEEGMFE